MLNVLTFGSTGSVGNVIFDLLRNNNSINKIYVVCRKKIEGNFDEKKIKFIEIEDIGKMEYIKSQIDDKIDYTINTLGSRVGQGGQLFRKIDKDIVLYSYKLSNDLNSKYFSHITCSGAKSTSCFLYLRVKGEVENELKKFSTQFNSKITIYRPGAILNRNKDSRFGEKIMKYIPFISKIEQNILAKNILEHDLNAIKNNNQEKFKIIEHDDILKI